MTEEQAAALETRVARLEAVVGNNWWDPRQDWDKLPRPPELPSGDYNLYYRVREIGQAIDSAVQRVLEFGVRLDAMVFGGACPLVGPTPEPFQWPHESNGYSAPPGSGGPSGRLADKNVHTGGFVCIANTSPEGTDAVSGANGQGMGIGGRSKGRIRVNTRGGAEGDGGMRDITNHVELEPRVGVGTVTRRGFNIFCSKPDALSIRTAVWTINPDGRRDGGVYLVKRLSPTQFVGNWSDPALDYESRAFIITGADQPDKDRFSTKSGADSDAGYGWRVDKPGNSTEAHPTYDKDNPDAGFTDGGDFLVRLFHDNGSKDIGRYSRYKTLNEGRGMAWAVSDGRYASCADVLVMQPGRGGQPGHVDLAIEGYGLRVLEIFDLPDGRKGLCFAPARVPAIRD